MLILLNEKNCLPELVNQANQLPYEYADGEGIDFEPYDAFKSAEETAEWFQAWTGNPNADGSRFRVFGQDGSGGYTAFWIVRTCPDLLEQPIVFLGAEGETAIVARNFYDYLSFLAAGLGSYEAATVPEESRISQPNWSRLHLEMLVRLALLCGCFKMQMKNFRASFRTLKLSANNDLKPTILICIPSAQLCNNRLHSD
ncbi:hypothetical protein [Pseudoduganella namucuonensis]|uniref:hypothetical protein n=1 Tax=Pseudoduganella namucuonensis TaxID=1035707 RepID=UPI000ABA7553|nr:hypothetical protein [Pseudoduganella namucuonensis]